MRVNVEDISDGGISLTFAEEAESFPSLLELSRSGECHFPMPLVIDLHIRPIAQLFEADGRFATRVRLTCGRCLRNYETPLRPTLSCPSVGSCRRRSIRHGTRKSSSAPRISA
jgi:uncharacterized protein